MFHRSASLPYICRLHPLLCSEQKHHLCPTLPCSTLTPARLRYPVLFDINLDQGDAAHLLAYLSEGVYLKYPETQALDVSGMTTGRRFCMKAEQCDTLAAMHLHQKDGKYQQPHQSQAMDLTDMPSINLSCRGNPLSYSKNKSRKDKLWTPSTLAAQVRLATFNRALLLFGYCSMRAKWEESGDIFAKFQVQVGLLMCHMYI
jgi:hypothetical protein